jgi:hypothetical protein
MLRKKFKWRSHNARHRDGTTRSIEEVSVWRWSEGVASISFRIWSTNKWLEPLSKAKPFCISKRFVFEAYKRVKANQGADGIGSDLTDGSQDVL